MPVHMTYGRQLPPFGIEPMVGPGYHVPAAIQLGLGAASRFLNPGRLALSEAPLAAADPSRIMYQRLMHPQSMDATRILDAGAPAPARMVEYAPFAYRPTEAPIQAQRSYALGGRHVMFAPVGG